MVANKNKMSAVVVYFIYIFIYLFNFFFFLGGGGGLFCSTPYNKAKKETEVSQVIDNFYMLLAKFLWVLNSQNLNVFKLGICFLN